MPHCHCVLLTLCLTLMSQSCQAADPAPPTGSAEILPEGARVEELWNQGEFTEGVAVSPEGKIYFSDIPQVNPGAVYVFDPHSKQVTKFCADSGKSNGLFFDREGNLIAACGANAGRRAVCEIDKNGQVRDLVDRFEGRRLNAPNDLVIHPSGAIYFSDPRYVGDEPIELDQMSVFRFDPRTKVITRATTEISKPNGVILSPDAKTLYVAETDNGSPNLQAPGEPGEVRMTLNAFPVHEDGTLGEKKVLANFGQKTGIDGMTTDIKGHIYGALRRDDRYGIIVLNPHGKEEAFIPTPTLPTNCTFGIGSESKTLYITAGGGLYRIHLKIDGYHPLRTN